MAPTPLPSKLLILFSSLLLAHACYSAHEHSLLPLSSTHPTTPSASSSTPASSSSSSSTTLPLDITLETLLSVSLLSIGIITSGRWELKPISLRTYAGMLESGRLAIGGDGSKEGSKGKGRGMYAFLDEKSGFLDIRKQRKEFSDWVKEGELRSAMEE